MSEFLGNTEIPLLITSVLGIIGIGALFLRDYFRRQGLEGMIRKYEEFRLPEWLKSIVMGFLVIYLAFVVLSALFGGNTIMGVYHIFAIIVFFYLGKLRDW